MVENLKCMYCAENGITNPNVFIEIVDVELGAGWICKECFIESEKEKDEHLKDIEGQLASKTQECEELKEQYNCYACDTCKGKEDYINLKRHYENAIKSLHNKYTELDQLKAENESYKQMLDNPEVRVALTDIRTGERALWQKYKSRMEQAEQKLEKIEKILKDFHYAIIPFHRGINHEMADRIDYYLDKILKIINEVEE